MQYIFLKKIIWFSFFLITFLGSLPLQAHDNASYEKSKNKIQRSGFRWFGDEKIEDIQEYISHHQGHAVAFLIGNEGNYIPVIITGVVVGENIENDNVPDSFLLLHNESLTASQKIIPYIQFYNEARGWGTAKNPLQRPSYRFGVPVVSQSYLPSDTEDFYLWFHVDKTTFRSKAQKGDLEKFLNNNYFMSVNSLPQNLQKKAESELWTGVIRHALLVPKEDSGEFVDPKTVVIARQLSDGWWTARVEKGSRVKHYLEKSIQKLVDEAELKINDVYFAAKEPIGYEIANQHTLKEAFDKDDQKIVAKEDVIRFYPGMDDSIYYNCYGYALGVMNYVMWPGNKEEHWTVEWRMRGFKKIESKEEAILAVQNHKRVLVVYGNNSDDIQHIGILTLVGTVISKLGSGPIQPIETEVETLEGNEYGKLLYFMMIP